MKRGFHVFRTRWGWCGYVACDNGVSCIILPVDEKNHALLQIEERWPGIAGGNPVDRNVQDELESYFEGEKVKFSFALDFSVCTNFAGGVYRAAMTIPYGEVRSYGWVSRAVDRPGGARAIGGAMGSNPFPPVVPCHRVVKSDGTLGGFSAQQGVPLKVKMLEMEGVRVLKGRIAR